MQLTLDVNAAMSADLLIHAHDERAHARRRRFTPHGAVATHRQSDRLGIVAGSNPRHDEQLTRSRREFDDVPRPHLTG